MLKVLKEIVLTLVGGILFFTAAALLALLINMIGVKVQ
jgi:hypothetical protein